MLRFDVPDMSCGHCVATIEQAIRRLDPDASLRADLTHKRVDIETGLSAALVIDALRDAGYPATAMDDSLLSR